VKAERAPEPVAPPASSSAPVAVVLPAPPPAWPLLQRAAELPAGWQAALGDQFRQPYFERLAKFLAAERQEARVYPADEEVLAPFHLTPWEQVRVVLIGDAPPAGAEAHGLPFSVRPGAPLSPALANLFRTLRGDLGCWLPKTGCLEPWARQGILLLNTVLTARAGDPDAHRGRGWEKFTDGVVRALSARSDSLVFLLCGEAAGRKQSLIDARRHVVLAVPDPADPAFLGGRPFSAVNNALELRGRPAVYWQIFTV
jgi:uracil-DNA glycosylase